MKHRKMILISLLAIIALMLAACGTDATEPAPPAENIPENENASSNDSEENAPEAESETGESQEDSLPEITPSVSASEQDASSGTVTIDEVVAAQSGWMVIHANADGAPGPVIGFAQVQEGANSNISVNIDLDAATETLFAMLHIDAGTEGEYEFPGEDAPAKAGDSVVVTPFMVTLPETSMGETMDESMDEVTVSVMDSFFNEQNITVKVGTTVTWVMDASFPHTVTADDGSFDSGTLRDGQTFSVTFDEPGEVPYYCSLHGGPGGAGMAGTITVTN